MADEGLARGLLPGAVALQSVRPHLKQLVVAAGEDVALALVHAKRGARRLVALHLRRHQHKLIYILDGF